MSKILAVDLDGTLLDIDKNISQEDIEAIRRWQASGNVLAIDSGRPLSFNEQLKKFEVYPDIFVGGVGSVCLYKDGSRETLYAFSEEIGTKIINLLIEEGMDFILTFDDDFSYCYNNSNMVTWVLDKNDVRNAYADGKKDGNKFFVFCPDGQSALRLTNLVNNEYGSIVKAVHTEHTAIEIIPYGCDKWQGLLKGLRHGGYEGDEIYCIGDSNNDMDMIAGCKENFVMRNCTDGLRAIADNIVDSVAEAIDILLRRS